MGTEVQVLLPDEHGEAITPVRELFADWEATLSRFLADSELSRLNARAGEPVAVSALLFEVVSESVDAAIATGGAFDPTLLRQLVRIGYSRPFERMPRRVEPVAGLSVRGGGWRSIAARSELEDGHSSGRVRARLRRDRQRAWPSTPRSSSWTGVA